MTFTSHEYLSAMRDFLLTVPAAPYTSLDMIDYGEIIENAGSDQSGAGNAVMLTGDQIVSRRRSVTGHATHNKRINFALILWRDTNDNDLRRDIASFLSRTINWINDENAKRGTPDENPSLPCFSMTEEETLTADGGIKTARLSDTRSEFSIQIHVDYQILYESSFDALRNRIRAEQGLPPD